MRYWVLSGITTESNDPASLMFSSNTVWMFLLIVPSSVSPIRAVAATVRSPSGPRKIKSPANSCTVKLLMQPMFLVTGCTEKSEELEPVSLNILFSQKINRLSRKTFNATTVSSTLILPAPEPLLKPSSLNGSLNTTSCGVVDLPP